MKMNFDIHILNLKQVVLIETLFVQSYSLIAFSGLNV